MIAPCKNCKDRKLYCHDKCKKYIEWKNKQKSRDAEECEYMNYLEGAMKRMKGNGRWA